MLSKLESHTKFQIFIITCILLLSGSALPQGSKLDNTFNRDNELRKFIGNGGRVKEISKDIYRLRNRIGECRTFYVNSRANNNDNGNYLDTTIINVWEIDTTKYNGMFTFWQSVEVANSLWAPLPFEDLNNNGRIEFYGYTDAPATDLVGPVRIYELCINGFFQEIFKYDSATIFVKGIGEVNSNENKGIILDSATNEGADVDYYPVYKSDSSGLPTKFDYSFYLDTLQINNMAFGDWNNNGIPDCAFTTSDTWDTTECVIAEYRDSINNFEELFQFSSIFESVFSGFAIDDFDQDGKTELVISSGPGNVFVIENEDENVYSVVNHFPFPVPNTYMQTTTKDIDGNGKPEFWIGGQDFEEGITVYQCYESDGDNSYNSVARIELRYSTSFGANYIQAIDIDIDGKEELIISSGNIILILKFVGSPDNHQYKLWYAKFGELTQPGAEFDPVTIVDVDGDNQKELIIPMEKYESSIYYAFSYILSRGSPNGIANRKHNEESLETIHCYPNPFNAGNTVSFNITKSSKVQLKIYNTLGKEIKTLVNELLSPGEYNIQWDAKDKYGSSLPSGVYFICLQTGNVIKTAKTILLK